MSMSAIGCRPRRPAGWYPAPGGLLDRLDPGDQRGKILGLLIDRLDRLTERAFVGMTDRHAERRQLLLELGRQVGIKRGAPVFALFRRLVDDLLVFLRQRVEFGLVHQEYDRRPEMIGQ